VKPFNAMRLLKPAPSGATDPFFANVSLLMHMEGPNGGTTFTDSSSVAHTITRALAVTSTAQFKFGGSSANMSSGRINVSDDTSLNLTTGNFTLEAFVYTSSLAIASQVIMQRNAGGTNESQYFLDLASGNPRFFAWDTGLSVVANITSPTKLAANTWSHVAVTRNGSTFTLWQDGVSKGTATSASALLAAGMTTPTIGAYNTNIQSFTGFIDEVRITKGIARYTGAFTPPSAQFPDA
jgi:hypothetical protein